MNGAEGAEEETERTKGGTGRGSLYRVYTDKDGVVAGARSVEWLRDMAATGGVMLSQKEGDVGRVVQEVGGTLCAPHVDSDMIRAYFERRRKIMSAEVLNLIAREGMPAAI